MRIAVDHLTEYHYTKPVSFGDHYIYLRPRESPTLRVNTISIECFPGNKLRWVRDSFNNIVAVANFGLHESDQLTVHCKMLFEIEEENPFDFILEPRAASYPFKYDERERNALAPYLDNDTSWGSNKTLDWFYSAVSEPNCSHDIIGFLSEINEAVHRDIKYAHRDDEGIQLPEETLEKRSGSCRDMALLFISLCRQLGFATRFVSGYLYVPPNTEDYASVSSKSDNTMHAWAEVFLPGAGWRGFDPTNGILANHFFLTSAVASRPEWINPIQGKYFSNEIVESTMRLSLVIEAIGEEV